MSEHPAMVKPKGSESQRPATPYRVTATPEKIVSRPEPTIVDDGRCGRWKRDGKLTSIGRPTRKQAALAKIKAAREKGRSPEQLEALARRIVVAALKDGARCRIKVSTPGQPCKQRHGNNTPRGAESPQWKHGEYSITRILNKPALAAYRAWLEDPARFDHARQGAGLEVLLVNQMGRLKAPALEEWKLVSEGWALIQEAAALRENNPEKALLLQGKGLQKIGRGVAGYDAEKDNAQVAKRTQEILAEQRKVSQAEDLRTYREQEVITLQQHTAQRAREVEVFWRAIEDATRGWKQLDSKKIRGALLAGVEAWRREGDLALRGPRAAAIEDVPADGGIAN